MAHRDGESKFRVTVQNKVSGPIYRVPDAALSEELLKKIVWSFHHEHVVQGHQDPADLAQSSHEKELRERLHRLDGLEGISANHLRQSDQTIHRRHSQ